LEHVDYVTISFDSTAKVHQSFLSSHNGTLRNVWTKFVTGSLYREDRLLLKDLHFGNKYDLQQFSVRFTNPDGSPYDLQGAVFSFTIVAFP
jgi:hypothetical protein